MMHEGNANKEAPQSGVCTVCKRGNGVYYKVYSSKISEISKKMNNEKYTCHFEQVVA